MLTFRLKELREDHDLTQQKIADLLKITRQNYSRWETSEKIIPLKHLNTLANYYDVSLDYITGINNIKKYPNSKKDINRSNVGRRLKEWRTANNITQEELANILNTTHSTISAYEHGKTLILTIFLYEIAKKFNVSIDYLCDKTKKHN